jgi:phosphatidate cytidylyltransferase
MLMKRVITAVIALAIFGSALFLLPQAAWALLLLVVLALGAHEWTVLAKYGQVARVSFIAIVVASAAALYWLPADGASTDIAAFAVSVAFWLLIAPFWLVQRWTISNPIVLGAAGWIALVPMWLALVRMQPTPWALLLVMSVVWIADTAAYAAGKMFGRHKLAPLISPGKTWEGAAGAAVGVLIYYGALVLLVDAETRYFGTGVGVALFLLILVLSIEGDLFESWLKRQAGVKDSGQLLPGHGGILDRIDGLTATMPLAALAIQLSLMR